MTEQDNTRREEIIRAALDVFSEVGYAKATIKTIARKAALKSPALIYWYFENKEELLKATLSQLIPVISEATQPEGLMDLPPDVVLAHLTQRYFEAVQQEKNRKLFRLFLAEAMHTPDMVDDIAAGGPKLIIGVLETYFARQIELGRLRPHNAKGSARAYAGMLIVYLLIHELMTPLVEGFPPPEDYARQIVDTFLHGLMTDDQQGTQG